MELPVYNMSGEQVSTHELPASIFEATINRPLMHQALVRQLANARLGTHKAKTRSEVNRSTAKIYRQKGTGRARHGSRKAPIFVGGGKAHGPRPRKYTKAMPRKMRRQALRSALSALAADDQIVVVDSLAMDSPKTSVMGNALRALVGDQSALLLLADRNEVVERSVRNLDNARYLRASYLNVRDLLSHDKVVIPQDALDVIQGLLGTAADR